MSNEPSPQDQAKKVRRQIPPRCNARASWIAVNGYRACDEHARGVAGWTEDPDLHGRCDFPLDGLGAAKLEPAPAGTLEARHLEALVELAEACNAFCEYYTPAREHLLGNGHARQFLIKARAALAKGRGAQP
jgi:hypothetical protein